VIDSGFIRENPVPAAENRAPDWTARFFILLAVVTVLRLAYLAVFPCGLVGDEAYYWDWGRRLDWGYFSKPPFIAWMMAGAGWLGGDTVFGLRMWSVLFGSGSILFAFLLGRRLYGEKTGFFAGALVAAMPGAVLLNLLLTIDAPLVFFWSAALYLFHRLDRGGEGLWRRLAVAAGLTLVLGLGHLSKQMMWLFPPLAVLYLLFDFGSSRERLKNPLLWSAFAASYLFLIPTLLWNARHGWITFLHTEHHFKSAGLAAFPKNFGGFAGMQLGAVSPIVAGLLFLAAVGGVFLWRRLQSRERFLVAFSGVPLLAILLLTLRQAINGNWAAAFYPAGLVLVAGVCLCEDAFPAHHRRLRRWLVPGLWVAVILCALVYFLPAAVHLKGGEGAKYDPYARLRGWDRFAEEVQKIRATLPRADAPVIVAGHRYYASELAFYLPGQPRVYHWPTSQGAIDSQYELWGGFTGLEQSEVTVVVIGSNEPVPETLRAALGWSTPAGTAVVEVGNGRMIRADLYRAFYIGGKDAPQ
jgi:hypothetical protein